MIKYYQILGLESNATQDQIKEAYRKLIFKFHPDRNLGDLEAEKKFKEIQEAYEILTNQSSKSKYFDDTFNIKINKNNPFIKGKDINLNIDITLEESYSGVLKKIKIDERKFCDICKGTCFSEWKACAKCFGSGKTFLKKSPFNIMMICGDCRGTGRDGKINCQNCLAEGSIVIGQKEVEIEIPQGIEDETLLRIKSYGMPILDGIPGDLLIKVNLIKHKIFQREGLDLYIKIPVTYSELIQGVNIDVPCINGKRITLKINPYSSLSNIYRVKNMGFINEFSQGDLLINLELYVNQNKDEKYIKLIQELNNFDIADRSFLN